MSPENTNRFTHRVGKVLETILSPEKIIWVIKKYPNLFLAIFSPILFLVVIEILFRFVPSQHLSEGPFYFLNPFYKARDLFLPDKELFWKFKPNLDFTNIDQHGAPHKIHINNLGFRGENYSPEKYINYKRVICLGDSCTFCGEAPDGKTYPDRLEYYLNENHPHPPVKVINAGTPGYNSYQLIRIFRKYIDYFDPAIVVIWTASNDKDHPMLYPDKEVAEREARFYQLRHLLLKSRFYSYVSTQYQKIQGKRLDKIAKQRQSGKTGIHRNRVPMDDFREYIREMIVKSQEKNRRVILMTRHVYNNDKGVEQYNDILRDLGKEYQVDVVDIAQMFREPGIEQYYNRLPEDLMHLNVKGSDKVAKAVADTIMH